MLRNIGFWIMALLLISLSACAPAIPQEVCSVTFSSASLGTVEANALDRTEADSLVERLNVRALERREGGMSEVSCAPTQCVLSIYIGGGAADMLFQDRYGQWSKLRDNYFEETLLCAAVEKRVEELRAWGFHLNVPVGVSATFLSPEK